MPIFVAVFARGVEVGEAEEEVCRLLFEVPFVGVVGEGIIDEEVVIKGGVEDIDVLVGVGVGVVLLDVWGGWVRYRRNGRERRGGDDVQSVCRPRSVGTAASTLAGRLCLRVRSDMDLMGGSRRESTQTTSLGDQLHAINQHHCFSKIYPSM